ncbi:MAG: hypothetical protein HOE80_02660 [Candidatus Magasanikbacteria bacterium]|jgi:archaetidylinositol phosphate synthase|nr:hypothetical protein [Candidatus Magasanikbacteria bacterium]MBT4071601.1 hypothetical protein [Candidatus Magasanikbacteria bacterium]
MGEAFAGDKKHGPPSILGPIERKAINWIVPKLPAWMTSVHLVMSTVIWSLIIVFGSLAAEHWNINWLWLVSVMIFMQYVTDSLDGSLGKYRKEGLIKWGYYMDHFLDYVFLCSILIGYGFLLPDNQKYLLLFVLAILTAFMVNSFLAFAATNRFKISYMGIGPTEIRLLFIIINTLIITFGKTYMAWSLPYVLLLSFLGLCIVVYRTQKEICADDMHIKSQKNT